MNPHPSPSLDSGFSPPGTGQTTDDDDDGIATESTC